MTSEYKEVWDKACNNLKEGVGIDVDMTDAQLETIRKALRIADAVERKVNHYLSHIDKTYKDDDLTDYETVKFLLTNILKECENE